MSRRVLIAGVILSCLAGSTAFAEEVTEQQATFMDKNAEIGIMGVGMIEGQDDDPLDNNPGVGLRAGYRFAPSWSVVAEVMGFFNADYDSPAPNGIEVDVADYIAGLNYDVFPDSDFATPFVSLGVGFRTMSDVEDRDNWNILPGLGVKFLLSDSVQLLLEGKARFNLEEDEKGGLGTVALSYRFGGTEPAPVPEPAPVEEVAPAPEPEPLPEPAAPEPVDLDSDGDGVLDSMDACPNTPAGLKVDANGCPETMNLMLNFKLNSAEIEPSDNDKVNGFSTFLNENPAYNVTLVGHTDSTGTEAYNQELSEKRADSVKTALVQNGVDNTRIATEGKGESQPIADNATKEGRAQNRRIEAKLSLE